MVSENDLSDLATTLRGLSADTKTTSTKLPSQQEIESLASTLSSLDEPPPLPKRPHAEPIITSNVRMQAQKKAGPKPPTFVAARPKPPTFTAALPKQPIRPAPMELPSTIRSNMNKRNSLQLTSGTDFSKCQLCDKEGHFAKECPTINNQRDTPIESFRAPEMDFLLEQYRAEINEKLRKLKNLYAKAHPDDKIGWGQNFYDNYIEGFSLWTDTMLITVSAGYDFLQSVGSLMSLEEVTNIFAQFFSEARIAAPDFSCDLYEFFDIFMATDVAKIHDLTIAPEQGVEDPLDAQIELLQEAFRTLSDDSDTMISTDALADIFDSEEMSGWEVKKSLQDFFDPAGNFDSKLFCENSSEKKKLKKAQRKTGKRRAHVKH
eukprot:TRINITY_DN5448_c0_g1_i1.p1 TRINITY_DN5448_c0_g1~~TRINITY_DN5448_c0_g1_i1.p1  ORF type:complete len:376 (+),score=67.66 TRINITY_DN5448_c0_g1_i1:59-1186(+)